MPVRPFSTDSPLDLLIVGLGPAGIACLLQARRDGLNALALHDEPTGGLVRAARRLDNLPGFPGFPGRRLADRLQRQLESHAAPTVRGRVVSLDRRDHRFRARTAEGLLLDAGAVCLATGTRPVPWPAAPPDAPLHPDARRFPPDLAGRSAVIVGAGEIALDTALAARDRGAQVRVLARSRPASAPALLREARQAGIEIQEHTTAAAARFHDGRWRLDLLHDGRPAGVLEADLLAACVGRRPADELWRPLAPPNAPLAGALESGVPGLFLAGDLIRGRDRYVAAAFGDGQRAACAAAAWLAGGPT